MDDPTDLSAVQLHFVDNIDTAFELKRWFGERHDIIAVDTETTGLRFWTDKLRLVQFGDTEQGWAIPWERWGGVIEELLFSYEGSLVGHNSKFDGHFLERNTGRQLPWHRIHDTRIMAHIIDPGNATGLKPLATRYISPAAMAGEAVLNKAKSEQGWTWETIPLDFPGYWAYGALDTVLTSRLFKKFEPQIMSEYRDVYDLELAVSRIIMRMETRGARIDVDYVRRQLSELEGYMERLTHWCVSMGVENPGSSIQVATRLQELGVVMDQLTPTGKPKVDAETLEVIIGAEYDDIDPTEVAAWDAGKQLAYGVLARRKTEKVAHGYLQGFLDGRDGEILHPNINTLGARTARMSMDMFALQTLPRRNVVVRNAFIPDEGESLLAADFDQVEMRVFAHFSDETELLAAIRRGDELTAAGHKGFDVHSMFARGIYGIADDQPVPKRLRDITKNASFARLFVAGVEQFSMTARVPMTEGKAFLDQYDATYPGVRRFQRMVDNVAKRRLAEDGVAWIKTPIGRRHPSDPGREYTLVNYLIQGTAADVFKQSLVRMDQAGLGEFMIVPVHDEEIFSVPTDQCADVAAVIERTMRDDTFKVPLTVGVEGPLKRWGEKYA